MRARTARSFGERVRNERLPAEARVDRHDEHEVELVQRVVEPVERRRRIEHEPRLAAAVVDEADRAVDVLGRLRMEADDARRRPSRNRERCDRPASPSGARRSAPSRAP